MDDQAWERRAVGGNLGQRRDAISQSGDGARGQGHAPLLHGQRIALFPKLSEHGRVYLERRGKLAGFGGQHQRNDRTRGRGVKQRQPHARRGGEPVGGLLRQFAGNVR